MAKVKHLKQDLSFKTSWFTGHLFNDGLLVAEVETTRFYGCQIFSGRAKNFSSVLEKG